MGKRVIAYIFLASLSIFLPSCNRPSRVAWEDTKSAGRYMNRGLNSFLGRHEAHGMKLKGYRQAGSNQQDQDFLALSDDDRYQGGGMHDYNAPLSKESPGDPGSSVPGIDAFCEPSGELARLFNNIHFGLDNYVVQGQENVETLEKIAAYLAQHNATYVFVEGHADERGSASYNLSLGSKRANSVRNFLVEHGVSPDQLFSISYGKERPIVLEHDELAWNQNRRAQFKLYEK